MTVNIRVVEIDNVFWFITKDVCDVLNHNFKEILLKHIKGDKDVVTIQDYEGVQQRVNVINLQGLRSLVAMSNAPAAELYPHWESKEVYYVEKEIVKMEEEEEKELIYLLGGVCIVIIIILICLTR